MKKEPAAVPAGGVPSVDGDAESTLEKLLALITSPPPVVANLLAAIGSVVSLFLTQNLIDNKTAQLVTGLASIALPVVYALVVSIQAGHAKQAAARIRAAHIIAAAPHQQGLTAAAARRQHAAGD